MDFYGTVDGFKTYHTARGHDVSVYPTAAIERALLVASEWLDGSFRHRWPGYKPNRAQVRDWPRSWVADREGYPIPADEVPIEIEQATYEATFRQLSDGALITDHEPERYKRVSIDGALSVEYRGLDASAVQKQFPVIGHILDRLLGGSGVSSLSGRVTRA